MWRATYLFISVHTIILFIQEELWAAVEAEVLDATWEIDITGEDAEAFHSAYIAKVNNHAVWQWFHILAPSRVPIGLFVAVNHIIGNSLTKCLGIGVDNIPLILVYYVAALVYEFNLADARVLAIIGSLHVDAQMTQCLYAIEGKLLPTGLVLDCTFEDAVILIKNRNTVVVT